MNSNTGRINHYCLFIKRICLIMSFLILAGFAQLNAQSTEVTGTIVDAVTKETLPGVSVLIEGTTRGTITDYKGNYKITVPAPTVVLVAQFIGYKSEKVPVDGKSVVEIQLNSDVKGLEDIVVIGYGSTTRANVMGSISSISEKDLKDIPAGTAAEAIAGKIAGVQVTSSDGEPGAEIQIRVRGNSSITQDSSPLYIIDGFPSNLGLTGINPSDIVSMDVYKDASSTAIYGARGANGVVVVTTKGGKTGRTTVSYNAYWGKHKLARKLDLLTPYDYSVYQWEMQGGTAATIAQFGKWDDLYSRYSNDPGYDWQNICFGKAVSTQSHDINISGGGENTKFLVGYSRYDDDGILILTGTKRNMFRLKLDQIASEKLRFSVNASYQERSIAGGGSSYSSGSRLLNIALYRPTAGVDTTNLETEDYDPLVAASGVTNNLVNPLTAQEAIWRMNRNKNLQINGGLDFTIVKNLVFHAQGGYSSDITRIEAFDDYRTRDAINKGGPFGQLNINTTSRLNNIDYLSYNLKVNKHNIGLTAGAEQTVTHFLNSQESASNFPQDNMGIDNLSMGQLAGTPTTDKSTNALMSFFGRASYSYGDRYLVQSIFRADGSSLFGAENRWGYFPSLSIKWRINNEEFMKPISIISDLSIRASTGVSGSNNIPNYQTVTGIKPTGYGLNNAYTIGVYESNLANPNLKWEQTKDEVLGLDWGVLNNRFSGTVELYRKTTTNLLLSANVSPVTGFATQMLNVGSTRNKGLEITINSVNVKTKSFQWNTSFNITFNRNSVLALVTPDGSDNILTSSRWSPSSAFNDFLVQVGSPLGQMYGYVYDGWYTPDDFAGYDPVAKKFILKPSVVTNPNNSSQPGDVKLKSLTGSVDANGRPIITTADQTIIGHAQPKHYGGINNTFKLKGFDLSVFLNWQYGNDIYNANKYRFASLYANNQNTIGIMRERFRTIDGAGNKITDLNQLAAINQNAKIFKPNNGIKMVHSWAIEDGSYLRINNISFGYTFPTKWLDRVYIKTMRIYSTVNNPFMFTNYTGYDPDINTRTNPLTPGVDYSGYPRVTTWTIGVNVTL